MFDQDLPKCNNPQRDFLLVANVDLVVKAPVMAVFLWHDSGSQRVPM